MAAPLPPPSFGGGTKNPPQIPYYIGGGRGAGGGFGPGRSLAATQVMDDLRRRLRGQSAAGLPDLPGAEQPPFTPPSGRGGPQVEYPIPPPPPIDREAQLRHAMNPGQINPYRGIAGFEHYHQPDLNVPGDALSKFFRRKLLAEGYPTRERVQGISDALGRLQGFNYGPGRTGAGQGVELSQDDRLRRLLEQRMSGGGGY